MVKNLPANVADTGNVGSIPGLGRSPGKGNGSPLQYSGLENSMDGGAWWAIVLGIPESDMTEQLYFSLCERHFLKFSSVQSLSSVRLFATP